MYSHYAWERYSSSGFYAGDSASVMNPRPVIDEEIITENSSADSPADYDPHLCSTERISGYHIHAINGDIGHLKDFIIDSETWKMTDLVIDTHNWIGGHKVLVPVRHVQEIQWENFKIIIDISKEYLKDCQVFNEPGFVFPQNVFEL